MHRSAFHVSMFIYFQSSKIIYVKDESNMAAKLMALHPTEKSTSSMVKKLKMEHWLILKKISEPSLNSGQVGYYSKSKMEATQINIFSIIHRKIRCADQRLLAFFGHKSHL